MDTPPPVVALATGASVDPMASDILTLRPVSPTTHRNIIGGTDSAHAGERTRALLSTGPILLNASADILDSFLVMCECEGWASPYEVRLVLLMDQLRREGVVCAKSTTS
jgi:hypothetical protein